MKRMIHLLCGLIFIFCLAMPVSAADEDLEELRNLMVEAMESGERVDISAWHLTQEEMAEIYSELFNRGLFPWYADTFCDWTASPDGKVAMITLRDLRKGTYRSFSEDEYERKMAELIAQTCFEGMTDIEKVLSVHDYIVSHTQYSYMSNINNGYHALIRGETRCYGYAQLFLRVMKDLGIPCQILLCDDTGDGVGHAWNVVQLDGNWYHLDLTWDDAVPDAAGRAFHTYFLKTDQEFIHELDHDFEWYPEIECNDLSFSFSNLWNNTDSPIIYLDAQTLILRQTDFGICSVYLVNTATGEEQILDSMEADWYSTGLCYWNGRIWYNTAGKIYSMNPDGSDQKLEYQYTTINPNSYLYGFSVNDGTLTLSILTFEGEDYRVKNEKVELTGYSYHSHEYEATTVPATCTAGGYTEKTCSCGITYQFDKSEPTGHTTTEETTDGTLRISCINCDYTTEEPVEIQPTATEYSEIPSTEAEPAGFNGSVLLFIIPVSLLILALLILKKRK